MDTAALTRHSAAVVHARVESVAVVHGAEIETWVELRVIESLKGARGRARLTLRLPGGASGEQWSRVYGTPSFETGSEVVVFAAPTKGGALTVTGLFQGKFRVEAGPSGRKEVVQDTGQGAEVVGAAARPAREPLRTFLGRVRAQVRRSPGTSLPGHVGAETTPPAALAAEAPIFLNPLLPLRWFEPDAGLSIPLRYNPAGAPVFASGVRGGFEASLANWTNVTGSTVVLGDGGDTNQSCRVFFDGSVVSHGDPCDQMPAFDTVSCSGVLAITGVSGFSLETKTVNGVGFLRLTEADVVFNAGIDCFLGTDRRNYEEVLSHEMGHVIGLGHSCGDSFSPPCAPGTEANDALMAAFANGGGVGGTPRAYDVDGARFIYPPAGFLDLVLNGSTFGPGDRLNLTAEVNGTVAADFYLVLFLPDQSFVAVAPGNPRNVLVPTSTGVQLSFMTDVPLISTTLNAAPNPGDYAFVGFFTRAGTSPSVLANWLSVDFASFRIPAPGPLAH
jgi:hypothetical protein